MLNWFYRALNNKKGFTLIEVLVVVAIIGILAALAAPRVIQRINDSRVAADEAMMKIMNDAVIGVLLDAETSPGTSDDLAGYTYADIAPYLDNSARSYLEQYGSAITVLSGWSFPGRSGKTIIGTIVMDENNEPETIRFHFTDSTS